MYLLPDLRNRFATLEKLPAHQQNYFFEIYPRTCDSYISPFQINSRYSSVYLRETYENTRTSPLLFLFPTHTPTPWNDIRRKPTTATTHENLSESAKPLLSSPISFSNLIWKISFWYLYRYLYHTVTSVTASDIDSMPQSHVIVHTHKTRLICFVCGGSDASRGIKSFCWKLGGSVLVGGWFKCWRWRHDDDPATSMTLLRIQIQNSNKEKKQLDGGWDGMVTKSEQRFSCLCICESGRGFDGRLWNLPMGVWLDGGMGERL